MQKKTNLPTINEYKEIIAKAIQEKCKSNIDTNNGVNNKQELYKYLKNKYNLKYSTPQKNKNEYHTLTLKNGTQIQLSKKFVEQDIEKLIKNGTSTKWISELIENYEKLPNKIKETITTIQVVSEFNDDGTIGRQHEQTKDIDDYRFPITCRGHIGNYHNGEYPIRNIEMTIYSSAFAGANIGIKGKKNISLEKFITMGGVNAYDIKNGKVEDIYNDGDDLYIHNSSTSNPVYSQTFKKNVKYKQQNKHPHPYSVTDINHTPNTIESTNNERHISDEQNFYEAGAMVLMGYKNPNNPNAKIHLGGKFPTGFKIEQAKGGKYVDYNTFAKQNPYLTQYFVKEFYDENIDINTIIKGE